jgi:general secretion pathway protein F
MIIRKMEVSGVTRTLGTLIKSGVPMIQALVTARAVVGNVVISNALGDVEVGVREGAGVSNPLARSGAFPALAVQMISVGEETGKLDEMLLRVAEHYDKEVRAQVMQFTRLPRADDDRRHGALGRRGRGVDADGHLQHQRPPHVRMSS